MGVSVGRAGRWAAGLTSVAALAATAAGCASAATSSSAPAAAGTSAAATPASSASSASPAAASSGSGSATASGGAASPTSAPGGGPSPSGSGSGPAACATRDLSGKVGIGQGAAGSVYQVIDFTNISSAPCTLYGYPGVSLAGGKPVTQVGAAATRDSSSKASVITLVPGATANALLRITTAQNYPSATCSPTSTTYLQIYPPNQFTPIYLAYSTTGCAKTAVKLLTISVVSKGSGG